MKNTFLLILISVIAIVAIYIKFFSESDPEIGDHNSTDMAVTAKSEASEEEPVKKMEDALEIMKSQKSETSDAMPVPSTNLDTAQAINPPGMPDLSGKTPLNQAPEEMKNLSGTPLNDASFMNEYISGQN